MPIRWSALKVSEAADMIEEYVNQAAEPLEQVRIVAREARKIEHLPQYVGQHLNRIICEIDRSIGGSLKSAIEAIRKDLPEGSIKAEQERAKHGTTQALI